MSDDENRWLWNRRPVLVSLVELVCHIDRGMAARNVEREVGPRGVEWVELEEGSCCGYVRWTHLEEEHHPDSLGVWIPMDDAEGLDTTTWELCWRLNKRFELLDPPVCFWAGHYDSYTPPDEE